MNSVFAEMLDRHGAAVLAFSGGAESCVLAHALRDFADRIDLVWVNVNAFPHMRAFVEGLAARYGFRLVELTANQAERFSTVGIPARIVPVVFTPLGKLWEREPENRLLLSDWYSCCAALRRDPLDAYVKERGATLVINGQRLGDNTKFAQDRTADGVDSWFPLARWTRDDVLRYVADHGVPLPEQYDDGFPDSGECWNCTAELNPDRFRWMQRRYPDLWARLKPDVLKVQGALLAELDRWSPGLCVAMEP